MAVFERLLLTALLTEQHNGPLPYLVTGSHGAELGIRLHVSRNA